MRTGPQPRLTKHPSRRPGSHGGGVASRGAGPAGRGQPPPEPVGERPLHKLSNRQYEQLLRQNFVNVRRVREWRDVHSQLLTVVTEHKWRLNEQPASYEQLHKAMLSGLLGNIGFKPEDPGSSPGQAADAYLGARGI